jgi:tripartite ATP-independent transporter DctM subunit
MAESTLGLGGLISADASAAARSAATGPWRWLEWIAGLLIAAITGLVTLQVFARYVLNNTPAWSEELARYLFLWASFLGACVALHRHAHLGVDSFVARLPGGTRRILRSIVTVLVGAFAVVLGYYGAALLPAMATQRSPTLGISIALVFAVVPLTATIIIVAQARALAGGGGGRGVWLGVAGLALGTIALTALGGFVRLPPGLLVVILVVTLVALIAIHTPIAFAVGLACVVYLVLKNDIPLVVVPHRAVSGMDSFLLLALPLFVLAGDLMNTGGITERLVGFAKALVGHIRGGLGMTTVVTEYLFSGISGSSAADVSAVGSLLIPSMERAGYRSELAVSIVAAASAMGVLVPPCLMMVVLASLTDLSIAALFMAGFLPAAAMGLLLLGLIYVQARRLGLPREPRPSARQFVRSWRRGVLPLFAPVIILGGILAGVVTPTEAAVLAVIYALFLGLVVYRELGLRDLMPIFINTASLTGMVMLLVGTASLLSWIFAAEGIPGLLGGWMLGLSNSPVPVLLVTILVFVPLGALLEGLPAMIILVPVFFPVAARFGIDPLHYGVLVVAALGLGLFIPPFGVGFFIACALGRTTVETAARAYLPYLLCLLAGLLLVAFVPWLTLVIPRLMKL